MKRWEIVLAIAGILILGLLAEAIRVDEIPHHDFVLETSGCRTPVTVFEPYHSASRVSAIVIHGLSANRRIMQSLAAYLVGDQELRAYLIDLPGHGDNTDPFSFLRAEHCAGDAVEALVRSGMIDPKQTVLIGHSMGGAIAIRLADREPVAGTIAISPAPTPLPRRMPSNLLVFSAQFDLPIVKRAPREIAQAAGGDRTQADDFLQHRAFHSRLVSYATHTSVLFDPRVLQQTEGWASAAVYVGAIDERPSVPWGLWDVVWPTNITEGIPPSLWSACIMLAPFVGCAAIFILFPLSVTIAAKTAGTTPIDTDARMAPASGFLMLVEGAVCALASALILALVVPLKFLHLYAGDYLASLIFIVGTLLVALNWRAAKQSSKSGAKALVAAAALGFAVMLGLGAWLNWQLADLWLNSPRWLRFAELLPVTAIFCFAEEIVLGPIAAGWRRALRFALSLAVRAELWLACLLAYYLLASGQVLLLVLGASLALFSILQRLATDALRLRTGSPTAAAVFGAILAAWFIAAVFPLT
jgi:pimeloyl-ACP methyl ester carboxylesterase